MTSESSSKSSPVTVSSSSLVPPKIPPKPAALSGLDDEVNILLLGQTGVGKSTWINGLYNYFKYNSLQEAEQNLQFLIPFQFTMMDEDYNEILIKCPSSSSSQSKATVDGLLSSENFYSDDDDDDDDDNDDTPGESGSPTRHTRLYQIKLGTKIIRLIDTPGFASSIGQDIKNFDNIMSHLKSREKFIQKIHAILIFLKPNEARLDYKFQFSLRNLLTYLPRDAYKNLIFCFTNTRGNSFRPGETLTTLKTFFTQIFTSLGSKVSMTMDKSTLYCFDSEAVRYLGARQWAKNCSKKLDCFGAEQLSSAHLSWQASAGEAKRLLNHISSSSLLQPISVKTIVVINEIQNLLHLLRGPIVDLCLVIQGNIQKGQNFILANLKSDKRQPFKQLETIRFVRLRRARTVCISDDCPGQKANNNKNQSPAPPPSPSSPTALVNPKGVILYPNVCHDNCQIVNFGALGTPNSCDCFEGPDKRICKGCGCDYGKHISVNFESRLILEQDNLQVVEGIGDDLVGQLSKENESILRVGKTIRAFLKKHALVLYSDAITEYMEQRIQVEKEREKDKTKVGSCGRVEHFERMLDQYRNGIVVHKEDDLKIESTQDIFNMIEQLVKLPLMGSAVKSLIQEVQKLTMMPPPTIIKPVDDRPKEQQLLQQNTRDHLQGQSPQKVADQQSQQPQQQSRNAVNPFDRNGDNGNRDPVPAKGMRKSRLGGLRSSRAGRVHNNVNNFDYRGGGGGGGGGGRNHRYDCKIL